MIFCDQSGCGGHFAGFSSCRDLALYITSNDNFDANCGDMDFEGYYTLMLVQQPVKVDLDGIAVTVPAGHYIIHEMPRSEVLVRSYDTEAEARTAYTAFERRYHAWEDDGPVTVKPSQMTKRLNDQ